jgi:hypothetical protein
VHLSLEPPPPPATAATAAHYRNQKKKWWVSPDRIPRPNEIHNPQPKDRSGKRRALAHDAPVSLRPAKRQFAAQEAAVTHVAVGDMQDASVRGPARRPIEIDSQLPPRRAPRSCRR